MARKKRFKPKTSVVEQAFRWQQQLLPKPIGGKVYLSVGVNWAPYISVALTLLVAFVFMFRLFSVQVVANERYRQLADGNRIRETINYAPRGRILDRKGRVLADNKITFELSVTPILLNRNEANRLADYRLIAKLTQTDWREIKRRAEREGLSSPLPYPLLGRLSHKQALSLEQYTYRLEGIRINRVPVRRYNSEAGLAHIVGYTGLVSQADLARDGALLPIDYVGKTGVELQYDDILRGRNGFERTEVDTFGRPLRLLAKRNSVAGQDIYLTIDLDVQRRLAKELKQQMKRAHVQRASAVALDPKTGAVIAMVSLPYYDNNLFTQGISNQAYAKLINDKNQPLVNKVVAGGYTTGSTIKPLVASAALEEKVVTPETIIVDRGAIAVTSRYHPGAAFVFHGWRPGGLGPMNIRSAIAWSSNIYFYTVGGGYGEIEGLGVERLTKYYRLFGLGEKTGIDLPGEIKGFVPDAAWKQRAKGEPWYVGDTYNISIGQGDLVVSPLQLTLADMAVANGGDLLVPKLLFKIGEKRVLQRQVKRHIPISSRNLEIVREGMRQVIASGTTCECTFSIVPYKVAGKSGTAQTTSDNSRRPHAWYTAFAPYEDPKIMMTAMLEEGSGGSLYAAPVLAGAMNTYFSHPD